MLKVREVSFAPNGGEIRASLQAGDNQISMTGPAISQNGELTALVESLVVTIEEMTFLQTDEGYEIQASMQLADRPFVSTWVIDDQDAELMETFEYLMSGVGDAFLRQIQSLVAPVEVAQSEVA